MKALPLLTWPDTLHKLHFIFIRMIHRSSTKCFTHVLFVLLALALVFGEPRLCLVKFVWRWAEVYRSTLYCYWWQGNWNFETGIKCLILLKSRLSFWVIKSAASEGEMTNKIPPCHCGASLPVGRQGWWCVPRNEAIAYYTGRTCIVRDCFFTPQAVHRKDMEDAHLCNPIYNRYNPIPYLCSHDDLCRDRG